ncbi:MAG: restriction endonuclease subunit S [Bacteroidia bacterium]
MMQFKKYDRYKDSGVEWLGEIPEGWQLLSNKYVFNLKKNQVGKKSSDYVLLSLTLKGVIQRVLEDGGKFPAEFDTYQEVKIGDFIFCLFDVEETPRCVGLSDYDGMITGAYTVMEVNPNFDKRYLYYFFLNLDSDKRLRPLYTGLRNTISKDNFFSFKTFIPPLPEQTAIANFLDDKTAKIDQAITQKEKLIALLKERKQILIQNAVTGKWSMVNGQWSMTPKEKLKDSGVEWIGEIPVGWEVKRLKNFVFIQSGLTLGKSYGKKKLVSIPYLRVANVQDGYFSLNQISEVEIPEVEIPRYLLKLGDILVTEGGDIDKLGRGTIWNSEIDPCIHQNHIFSVRLISPGISTKFISIVFGADYGRKYFTHTANKTTNLASTNSTKLGNFPIALPPLLTQHAIVAHIETQSTKIDQAITLQQTQIEKLKEYKATLIDSAVTGKIKVSEL